MSRVAALDCTPGKINVVALILMPPALPQIYENGIVSWIAPGVSCACSRGIKLRYENCSQDRSTLLVLDDGHLLDFS